MNFDIYELKYNARHAYYKIALAVKSSQPHEIKEQFSVHKITKYTIHIFNLSYFCSLMDKVMKIGILKEEKIPSDKRVPLSPHQCAQLLKQYAGLTLVVQSSNIRCFTDEQYKAERVQVVEDLSDCDVLLGVKEVPKEKLIPNKTYFYFSHIIKEQKYNRSLLQKMLEKNIRMIDYEVLKDKNDKRILGFGRYAGIVGAYNGLLTYGLKSGKYRLKAAHKCAGRLEMEYELKKLKLKHKKIIVTGSGRVGNGILEIMHAAQIKEVTQEEFQNKSFDEAVFVQLKTMDYNVRIDGSTADKYEFYTSPELYNSSFMDYAKHADIFIAGHYYSNGSPFLFTREDAKSPSFNIKVVADVSCDIDGPVASTIRPSTIANPIYGYNPITEQEDDFNSQGVIAVMAVDNLPCELPKDASEDFGAALIQNIFPFLLGNDPDAIIKRATICEYGDLTPNFEYLRDYVNGN